MSKERGRVRVGISIGDLNGIGAEVVIKTLSDNRILEEVTPVIYASTKAMSHHRKLLGVDWNFVTIKDANEAKPKKIHVVNCWEDEVHIAPGERDDKIGAKAFQSLEAAVNDLAGNKIDVLVTAPIDKKSVQSENFNFPGHTEYLAKKADVKEALMLMVSDNLRVGVVTGHIPLNEVAGQLSKEKIIDKVEQMEQTLIRDFMITKPRIAVLGLNPHAGEKGMLGEEDESIILPAVKNLQGKDKLVFGPYAADGFFGSGAFTQFDGILAMYHDQGLIPFKALSFNNGVNYTAGLPIVRTSPDHGTGYEIAGKNMASEGSFRKAMFLARDVFLNRKIHREISANPLQSQTTDQEKG